MALAIGHYSRKDLSVREVASVGPRAPSNSFALDGNSKNWGGLYPDIFIAYVVLISGFNSFTFSNKKIIFSLALPLSSVILSISKAFILYKYIYCINDICTV